MNTTHRRQRPQSEEPCIRSIPGDGARLRTAWPPGRRPRVAPLLLGPTRPLVMLCPHADDGAITAACLIHEYAVRRGLPVIEVLVFAGERNVAAPWLNDQKKITVREGEFRLECNVLGAEAICWNLEGYNRPGYQPTESDIAKVVDWFTKRRPGAVIVPPANDAHVAHRVTRALAAIGLFGAELSDTVVLSGWTPWGPLPQPNAYFTYDGEAERTKEWAIHCHASQVLLTDYTQYCSHLGRAYAALTREWAEGHSLAGRAHRTDDRFVGVELFQIESYDSSRCNAYPPDPIQLALGLLSGKIAADPAESRGARRRPRPVSHRQAARRRPLLTDARADRGASHRCYVQARPLRHAGMAVRVWPDAEIGLPEWPASGSSRRFTRPWPAGRAVLGLATGSTPERVYAHLVERYGSGKLSFRNVTTYNLGRVLPDQPAGSEELSGLHAPAPLRPGRPRAQPRPRAGRDGARGVRGRARGGVRPLDRGRWRAGLAAPGDRPQRAHRLQRAQRPGCRRGAPAAHPAGRVAPGHPCRRRPGIRRRGSGDPRALTMGIAPILAARSIVILATGATRPRPSPPP